MEAARRVVPRSGVVDPGAHAESASGRPHRRRDLIIWRRLTGANPMATKTAIRTPFTGDEEADRLLSTSSFAL